MVESTPLNNYEGSDLYAAKYRLMKDENAHRTLNPSRPYNRKRRPAARPVGKPAILDADASLGNEKVIVMGRAAPDNCVKLIEQIGEGYESLKKKYAKLSEQMKKGASAHFE